MIIPHDTTTDTLFSARNITTEFLKGQQKQDQILAVFPTDLGKNLQM